MNNWTTPEDKTFETMYMKYLPARLMCPRLIARIGLVLGIFLLAAGCVTQPRFGNYSGPYQPQAPAKETPSKTGVLWHPIQARFAPDGRYLVANLCRSSGVGMNDCRLAEYWPAENRWRLLPIEAGHSYMWPSFSPDGKQIAFADLPCDEKGQCNVFQAQLVTMPAQGGPLTHYPVYGVRGPVFHPDSKKIAYWRYYGAGRLASGRMSSAEAIYEFDTTNGQEKNWLENTSTPMGQKFHAFDWSIAGPFYHPDGDQLQFCGYRAGGSKWVVDTAILCARLGRDEKKLTQVTMEALPTYSAQSDSSRVLNTLIVFGRGTSGTFIGQSSIRAKKGLSLAFINSATYEVERELLNYGGYTVSDADYSGTTRKAVAITGTLVRAARAVQYAYWEVSLIGNIAYPAMAIIDLDTLHYQAVEWPNVEDIHP